MGKWKWPFRKKNEGASLMAVISAIVFVMTIGAIVASVTVTNIRMREVEESGKRNFYNAEDLMNEIAAGLNNRASTAMQLAYLDILSEYRGLISEGANLQEQFIYNYMERLTEEFWDSDDVTRKDKRTTPDPGDASRYIYVYGYYDQGQIKDLLAEEHRDFFVSTDEEATFSADYEEGIFTLHGIKVDYEDEYGYETVISTDMVFHTPALNFDSGNRQKEFMKYALMADRNIQVLGNGASVKGSVYAGWDGIHVVNCDNVSFIGENIVTRGDIIIESGSDNASFGTAGGSVWAENIRTTGDGSPSSASFTGNLYVSDDLSLNGANSKVSLSGNYYGYNFLERYDGTASAAEAKYSSAMVINGRGSTLDMSGLTYLHLAGRTFLSRGNSLNDVMFGESVSVRTNQLAYYVPERYLDPASGYTTFTAEGLAEYEGQTRVSGLADYLNAGEPIAVYRFRNTNPAGDPYVYRYYLNFKDEQSANSFFAAYSQANASRVTAYGEDYADAIIVGDGMLYTLRGDLMYRNSAEAGFTVQEVSIRPEEWADTSSDGSNVNYTYADQLAKNYKSLQMYLEEWRYHADVITSSSVRFADKKENPLTDQLFGAPMADAVSALLSREGMLDSGYEQKTSNPDGPGNTLIAVFNSDYTIPTDCDRGIVIATGDVTVSNHFRGMILSGGSIQVATANIQITGDELLVSQLFSEDAVSASPKFSSLFAAYGVSEDNVIGLVHIDQYLTYENWTRTDF